MAGVREGAAYGRASGRALMVHVEVLCNFRYCGQLGLTKRIQLLNNREFASTARERRVEFMSMLLIVRVI